MAASLIWVVSAISGRSVRKKAALCRGQALEHGYSLWADIGETHTGIIIETGLHIRAFLEAVINRETSPCNSPIPFQKDLAVILDPAA